MQNSNGRKNINVITSISDFFKISTIENLCKIRNRYSLSRPTKKSASKLEKIKKIINDSRLRVWEEFIYDDFKKLKENMLQNE